MGEMTLLNPALLIIAPTTHLSTAAQRDDRAIALKCDRSICFCRVGISLMVDGMFEEIDLPPAAPPPRPRGCAPLMLAPAAMALVGILIATTAAIMGQTREYQAALLDMQQHVTTVQLDLAVSQAALLALKARGELNGLQGRELQGKIAALQDDLLQSSSKLAGKKVADTLQPGRHFAQWDGFRYEEIIESGYLSHVPTDSAKVRADPRIRDPRTGRPRLVNVSWYPLYPLAGFAVKFISGLQRAQLADLHSPDGFFQAVAQRGMASVDALTLVSRICCVLAAVVLFVLARDHFDKKTIPAPLANGVETPGTAEFAALWTVAFLFFAPDSIFLYSNFTEGLFTLLLAGFLLFVQRGWWWRAALLAGIAAACRSQGVLFGPMLALFYVCRVPTWWPLRLLKMVALGVISTVGIVAYMCYLHVKFGDGLAFITAQNAGWGAGIRQDSILYGLNPLNALQHFWQYVSAPVTEWPRVWESFCVFAGPLLLFAGWSYLSAEQLLVGVVLWALPYFSTSLMLYPEAPVDHWVSMGRYLAVSIPLALIGGGMAARHRWLAPVVLPASASVFAIFAYLHGTGAWLG
jgi:hypothetical protein